MTKQALIHYSAICYGCDARCDAKNAQVWAHNHARNHNHEVELQLAWRVCEEVRSEEKAQVAA